MEMPSSPPRWRSAAAPGYLALGLAASVIATGSAAGDSEKNTPVFGDAAVLYAQAETGGGGSSDRLTERERRLIRKYFEEHPLQSIGSSALPPDWREQARTGRVLSVALAAHAQPLPADLTLALGESAEGVGYLRIENRILKVATMDQTVLDHFEL